MRPFEENAAHVVNHHGLQVPAKPLVTPPLKRIF